MSPGTDANSQKRIGRWVSIGIMAVATVLGLVVLHKTTHHPRTDDATVLANYIGIAPQVEGPLVRLPVHDNQFVKKGELLFEIDDRPYPALSIRTGKNPLGTGGSRRSNRG
jgi:multidrug efflux system membrane fusion protein